jgi:hypothetical protein
VLEALGALDLGEEPALTVLRTEPTDQAGLHGVLERLRSLGLDLLEVRSAPAVATIETDDTDDMPRPRSPQEEP